MSASAPLPKGWGRVQVGDLLRVQYGKALPQEMRSSSARFPVLGSAGLMTRTQAPLVTATSIVIGRKGNIGAIQLPIEPFWPIDTVFYLNVPELILHAKFLKWQLIAVDFASLNRSTTTPSLRRQELENVSLVIPPLAEQHRIVEALEDHLSRLDAAMETLSAIKSRLSILLRAELQRLDASDRLVPKVRLSEIAKVTSGATPARSNPLYWDGGTIPWVTSGDLSNGDIHDVHGRITSRALAETSVKLLEPGTLLIAMYGEGKTRGTVAELKFLATTNQACAGISLHEKHEGLRTWVRTILESRYASIRSESSGGVQPNLTLGKIKEFVIPVPVEDQRDKHLDALSQLRTAINRVDRAISAATKRGLSLRRTLLTSAFCGALVDQDPADEPASVLLERIADERETEKPTVRRRSSRVPQPVG